MKKPPFFVLLASCVASSVVEAPGADHAFFEQKIRPVLVEHCYGCHSAQADKLKGGLLLDSKAGWQKGGDSGKPVIVPGRPEESLLIQSVRHEVEDLEMPPKKPKLPEAVIADLMMWVKLGAPDPREGRIEAKRADKTWWSLQPLMEFQVSGSKLQVRQSAQPAGSTRPETLSLELGTRSPIDAFIRSKLSEKRLKLNPPADPRSLIRRMTYDLHGLPPTPEEVEAFVKLHRTDPRQAVETLVDRLLASPRYGERWGRHWLDITRFGESNGFERNFLIDDLWPWRDWVIRSFNEDKPFNQFIIEHIAGDVIGKDDPNVEVGSAFLVAGPYDDVGNQDKVAQANIRAATLDDVITATGGAFLGLTINCARCHHHKFDPIPTEDYYRLRAAFEGVTHGRRVVASKAEQEAFAAATRPLNEERNRLNAGIEALEKEIETRARAELAGRQFARPKIDPQFTEETFEPVEARHVNFGMLANTSSPRSAAGAGRLTEFEVWTVGENPRNVALARNGAKAEGARSAVAEDFPEAYGPQFCIDGQFGEQWFIGSPAELTITLAQKETIARIAFSNAKGKNIQDKSQGATPCEYVVQVSLDGKVWRTVATSADRQPWSPAHGIERVRREVITRDEDQRLAGLRKQLAEVDRKLRAVPPLREVWAGNFAQPKERTFVHKGGDPMKPGEAIAPTSLSVLEAVTKSFALPPDAPEGERRLALAKWIASDDNPLTARVLANRVWQYHFGTGIVDTPSDFGFLGSQPTHPELLDYLAQRLLAGGWRLKELHREILLSQTYGQSSAFRSEAARADKDARLLWRFPPRRLGAEEIRDTMLAVAGKLQLEQMGGPGFRLYKYTQNNVSTYFPLDAHGPETYRRAVYHQNARASIVDVLNDFDLPDIAFAAPRRANTTTPLQALTLLNHSFTLDMARALAARLDEEDPVASAYRLAFQRPPDAKERSAADKLVATHGREAFCRALLNANELIHLE
jgi:mono/diheme cytochrome c family protein